MSGTHLFPAHSPLAGFTVLATTVITSRDRTRLTWFRPILLPELVILSSLQPQYLQLCLNAEAQMKRLQQLAGQQIQLEKVKMVLNEMRQTTLEQPPGTWDMQCYW